MAGQKLIDQYPRQRELCARASVFNARACLKFGDVQQAREWMREAEDSYADISGIQNKMEALKHRLAPESQQK